jgi:hypothetical protein
VNVHVQRQRNAEYRKQASPKDSQQMVGEASQVKENVEEMAVSEQECDAGSEM